MCGCIFASDKRFWCHNITIVILVFQNLSKKFVCAMETTNVLVFPSDEEESDEVCQVAIVPQPDTFSVSSILTWAAGKSVSSTEYSLLTFSHSHFHFSLGYISPDLCKDSDMQRYCQHEVAVAQQLWSLDKHPANVELFIVHFRQAIINCEQQQTLFFKNKALGKLRRGECTNVSNVWTDLLRNSSTIFQELDTSSASTGNVIIILVIFCSYCVVEIYCTKLYFEVFFFHRQCVFVCVCVCAWIGVLYRCQSVRCTICPSS